MFSDGRKAIISDRCAVKRDTNIQGRNRRRNSMQYRCPRYSYWFLGFAFGAPRRQEWLSDLFGRLGWSRWRDGGTYGTQRLFFWSNVRPVLLDSRCRALLSGTGLRVATSAWDDSSCDVKTQQRISFFTSGGFEVILCVYARRVWLLQTHSCFRCANVSRFCSLLMVVCEWRRNAGKDCWLNCLGGIVRVILWSLPSSGSRWSCKTNVVLKTIKWMRRSKLFDVPSRSDNQRVVRLWYSKTGIP